MRATLVSLGLWAQVAGPAYAQDPSARQFSIPAQPLSQALRAYAQQSGDQVVFYSDVGKGRESASVEGRYTREEALQKLLQNTGLKHRRVNAKTVAISRASGVARPAAQSSSSAAPLLLTRAAESVPAARQAARGAPSNEPSLFGVEEVIVTGTAVAARTKFDSSLAISTFDSDHIAQHAPASAAELIAAVPGFWVESTSGTTHGNVFARGIIQDGGYRYVGLMEDGIALYPVFELSFYNPDQFVRVDETLERVEAVRGGTAPIFTVGAVGGTVNFITRSPTDVPRSLLKVGFSDFGMYRGDVSYTGPISADWGIALGGYYRESRGVRDPGYAADEGGQLRVKLDRRFDHGRLELFGKYIDDRSLFAVPIPLTGDPSHPRGLNGADPGTYSLHSEDLARASLPPSAAEVGLQGSDLEDGIHPQLATVGARLDWQLTEIVSLTNLARYTDGSVRFDAILPELAPQPGTAFAAANQVAPNYTVLATGEPYDAARLVQNHGHWAVHKEYEALQDDLRINLSLSRHALTLGSYLADYSMSDRWSLGNLLLMDVSDRPQRLGLAGVTDPSGYTRYATFNLRADYEAKQYSLYAADEWQWTEALRIDVGVRYDVEEIEGSISNGGTTDLDGNPATRYDNDTSQAGTARRRLAADFSNGGFSVGFNYQFAQAQALFGHYTDSAKLPSFDDLRNGVREKDTVENVELGYKVALERCALFATLFQTGFDNVPFQDIVAGGGTIVRRAGTRTRGIELEGECRPLDSLDVRFSVTRQDPKYRNYTGGQADNTGNTIRRIPRTLLRVTPTYSFLDDRARVYLTYSYVGERYANDANTIELPSYAKLDAGLMFDVGDNWTLHLAGDNLTDAVGLTEGNPRTDVGATGFDAIFMARPLFGRSFTGSVSHRY